MGITIEAVEREVLGWDYYSVVSGDATREGIADAGHVPVTFDSLAAYSKVGMMIRKDGANAVVAWCARPLQRYFRQGVQ